MLVLLLAAGLLVAGCGGGEEETEVDGAVLVAVAEAEKGLLSRGDVLTGKVEAQSELNLVPKMPGKVEAVPVKVGDRVAAGQLLMQLESTDFQAQVRQAEAGLAAAQSGLRQAELNREDAARNYERMKLLFEQGAIPAAEFEKVELGYKIAVDQAENLAPAQLKQAQAGLEAAQSALNNTVLTSPIAGIVAARNVDPGELASQTMPAFTVINLDSVLVRVGASEQQVNKIKGGQEVKVLIKAVSEQPFTGVVTSISPATDMQTRSYPVKVQIANPDHLIKPGMFAEVDLSTAESEAILVPRDAVVHRGGQSAVFVLNGEETAVEYREIKTGGSDGLHIAVLEGLEEGEKVVVSGQDTLEDGTEVEVARSGV